MLFNTIYKISKWFLSRPIEYGDNLAKKWLSRQDPHNLTVISTKSPWKCIKDQLNFTPESLIIDPSLEVSNLDKMAEDISTEWLVGIGSGRIMDITKYLAFKCKRDLKKKIKVCLIPSILSTTAWANFGIAVRKNNALYMPGNYKSNKTIVDPEFIIQAPSYLNIGGIVDLIASASAISDWQLSEKLNDEKIPKGVLGAYQDFIDRCFENAGQLKPFTKESISYVYEAFMDALALCGASLSGRPMEGGEHFLYYCIDELDTRKWNHGRIIAFTTLVCLFLHGKDAFALSDDLRKYFDNIGVKYSLNGLELTNIEIEKALVSMKDFVESNEYYFTIWNHISLIKDQKTLQNLLKWIENF